MLKMICEYGNRLEYEVNKWLAQNDIEIVDVRHQLYSSGMYCQLIYYRDLKREDDIG